MEELLVSNIVQNAEVLSIKEIVQFQDFLNELNSIQTIAPELALIKQKINAILTSEEMLGLIRSRKEFFKNQNNSSLASINFFVLSLRQDFQEILVELQNISKREKEKKRASLNSVFNKLKIEEATPEVPV